MPGNDNKEEFDAFARTNRRWLRQQAYHLSGDWHEAEDLVQATLLKVYRHWGEVARREALGGYARRTLLNTYLSERRRPRWKHEVTAAALHETNTTEHRYTPVDDRLVLLAALRRLGPRQRDVVTLRFWEDLTVEQTATIMRCAPGTVKSQCHRALTTLREDLAAAFDAKHRDTDAGGQAFHR